jgi:hypothetical protein
MIRTIPVAVLSLSFTMALLVPVPADAQTRKRVAIESVQALSALPINGTTSSGGTFTGTFDLARLAIRDGKLVAIGTLSGTLKDAAGVVVATVSGVATELALGAVSGTCSILRLELGPLDLDLLGLQVHLNRVVLDITAVPGPGNLLGNLLCAIAHLLDARSPLDILADAINDLLRFLN